MDELKDHSDGVSCMVFANNMLYSGSFDHCIYGWDLKEVILRIRERKIMAKEDLWSRKYRAYYALMFKKGKGKSSGPGKVTK